MREVSGVNEWGVLEVWSGELDGAAREWLLQAAEVGEDVRRVHARLLRGLDLGSEVGVPFAEVPRAVGLNQVELEVGRLGRRLLDSGVQQGLTDQSAVFQAPAPERQIAQKQTQEIRFSPPPSR